MQNLEHITEILPKGQEIKYSDGKRRQCIYLAPQKIEKWWEAEIGGIAEIVRTSSKSVKVDLSSKAEVELGSVLAHFGLPSAAASLSLSLNKESVTSDQVKLHLSPLLKSIILEQHYLVKGNPRDWVTAKVGHLLCWQGPAEITELIPLEKARQILAISPAQFPYRGLPNELPSWIEDTELGNSLTVKLYQYGNSLPVLLWFTRPNHQALVLMNKDYVDLHRYISIPNKQIVFIGEPVDSVGKVRFMNPYAVWLVFN